MSKKGPYLLLKNNKNQYSLWLAKNAIPLGWQRIFGPGSKEACLRQIQSNPFSSESDNSPTLVQLFEQQAAATPNNIALVFENKKLSYKTLNESANQMAHYLKKQKLKPDNIVVICLERSHELIIAILGVLKAGGAYLYLDPSFPKERQDFILKDCKAKWLISQQGIYQPLHDEIHTLFIDSEKKTLSQQSKHNPKGQLTANHLAYIIYTSGSTGKPKGVEATHAGIVNRLFWGWREYPYTEDEICCHKTSFNFVDHVAELFSPLLKGVKLVLIKTEIPSGQAKKLLTFLCKHRITRLVATPSLLRAILQENNKALTKYQDLKIIFSSGEALPTAIVKGLYEVWPDITIVNLYGSSEVNAEVAYYTVKPQDVDKILPYFSQSLAFVHHLLPSTTDQSITRANTQLQQVKEKFTHSEVPLLPQSWDSYFQFLQQEVLPFAINTASPRFIGHMTSTLPSFVYELSRWVTLLNQNVVKIETSKSLTFLEREAIAMMHRSFYHFSETFYKEHIQNPHSDLGVVVSGGTQANITALWVARNLCFLPNKQSPGIAKAGFIEGMDAKNIKGCKILVSPLLHYSIDKAASLLGVGTQHVDQLRLNKEGKLDLNDLQNKISFYHKNKIKIMALIGIAGATETGAIDPLQEMADIARKNGIYFHVDAAFGGPIVFSNRFQHLLKGIEKADSISVCGHKQMYLPLGISLCLFKNPQYAKVIYVTTDYQANKESYDFGKSSVEGSRPAYGLFLHAALKLMGQKGYEKLINMGVMLAEYMVNCILASEAFELLWERNINIVNYRYIPKRFRKKWRENRLTQKDNQKINEANLLLQAEQFNRGKTFISKTTLPYLPTNSDIISLRAVIINPLTQHSDIDEVLKDQLDIAATLIEKTPQQVECLPPFAKQTLPGELKDLLEKYMVSIGKPILNNELYILNKQLAPVRVGEAGELYVAGLGLARGYLNRPALTAQSFIADPFSKTPGARMYRTKDVCRQLPDGNIEYIGRIDHQVKIQGYRIELGEIEHTLLKHPTIKEAVVMLQETQSKEKKLITYWVGPNNAKVKTPTASALKRFLAKSLPTFMIPDKFIQVAHFPLTQSGKLDRNMLVKMYQIK